MDKFFDSDLNFFNDFDKFLNSFIASLGEDTILATFALLVCSIFVVATIYSVFKFLFPIQKANITKYEQENDIESNDDPSDFEKFLNIYKYKDRRGFINLLDDLNAISKVITSKPSRESKSKTICIDGKWGSGKTSYLNILKDFDKSKFGANPVDDSSLTINEKINRGELIWVDDFQPWNFGNSTEMMREFFKVLAKKCKESGLGGVTFDWKYNDYVDLASKAFEGNKIMKAPFHFIFPKKTMPELKNLIAKDLKNLTKKIVFVLDDIDRESPEMIMEVLRLVKNVADFPNIIYVLPIDYEKVSSIITTKYNSEYKNYLQKITTERYKIANYSYEDLFSIFAYELRGDNELEAIAVQLYEFYRLQVWKAGYRNRIDSLISKGKLTYSKEVFVRDSAEFVFLSNLVSLVELTIERHDFKIDILYGADEYGRKKEEAEKEEIYQYKKILKTDLFNLEVELYKNFVGVNTSLKSFSNFIFIFMDRSKLEFEKSHHVKIVEDNFKFSVNNIALNMVEFAPTPRDLKEFARKILVYTNQNYRNTRYLIDEIGELEPSTSRFLEYLISEQNFVFDDIDYPIYKPETQTRFAPKILRNKE